MNRQASGDPTHQSRARERAGPPAHADHVESGPRGVLTVTHAAFEPQDTLDIFGSDGSIHVPELGGDALNVKTRKGERTESHPLHSNGHQPLVEDFVEAVLHEREPAVGAEAGREVQKVLERIYLKGL